MKEQKKCVPEIRFAGFTDDWEQRKFKDLLDKDDGIRRGPFGSALKKDIFVKKSLYVVYEQQNVINDHYETRYFISNNTFEVLKAFKVSPGDFLMSGAGTIGKISRVPNGINQGIFNQALIRFRIDERKIEPEYFLQLMRSEKMQNRLTDKNPGSAITNFVPMAEVKEWNILLPSLEEQTTIGNFFKQLDDTIALHQRTLEKYQKLKISYLEKMFPKENEQFPELRFPNFTDAWEQRKLGEIGEFNPKSELPKVFEYVDLESVIGTELCNHRTELKVSAPSRAKRLAQKGDLFYQSVRPYQKNNYLFELPNTDYVFSTGYIQIRSKVNGYFLLSYIQKDSFVKDVLERCTGTSYPAINSFDLMKIKLYLPQSLEEQTAIGNFFKQLDDTIALHRRNCIKFQNLKTAYLENIFSAKYIQNKDKNKNAWEQRKFKD